MKDTLEQRIEKLHVEQRLFFASHQTKDFEFRILQLKKLKNAIKASEEKILKALWQDLRKSREEAYLTEISIVTQEIDLHIKNLKSWGKSKRVPTPVYLKPSSSKIFYEPLGVALIIAPWNYPFQLLLNPLVGAISSGCCAILKPSEFTSSVAEVLEELISETFEEKYVKLFQGDQEIGEALLKQKYDMIFFTGSTKVGKIVMKAAANFLTPVVLELGGKSPCVIDANANIGKAAKRIIWGKTINAGQTCIAPDYLLAHESIKEELIEQMKIHLKNLYGENTASSKYYSRIVNNKTFDSLHNLLEKTNGIVRTDEFPDRSELYFPPTIIDEVKTNDITMKEEIFGPILPIITFEKLEDAISLINSREKPLALYYFGKARGAKEILHKTSSGGSSVNDTLMHITNHHLPFGGVGHSGVGKYHGKESFLAFSNQRSVVSTPTWIDVPFKYPPYKYFSLIKKFL